MPRFISASSEYNQLFERHKIHLKMTSSITFHNVILAKFILYVLTGT